MIYLDNQATTPCDPRVVAAMLPFFTERFGNPHSAEHAMGQDAEDAVETARAQIAALIGAEPREVVLTSGATEANNIAIKGAARYAATQGSERRRVITVATEHKCVLESVANLRGGGVRPGVPAGRPRRPARPGDAAGCTRRRRRCSSASWQPTTRRGCCRTSSSWPPLPTQPAHCSTPTQRRRWAR